MIKEFMKGHVAAFDAASRLRDSTALKSVKSALTSPALKAEPEEQQAEAQVDASIRHADGEALGRLREQSGRAKGEAIPIKNPWPVEGPLTDKTRRYNEDATRWLNADGSAVEYGQREPMSFSSEAEAIDYARGRDNIPRAVVADGKQFQLYRLDGRGMASAFRINRDGLLPTDGEIGPNTTLRRIAGDDGLRSIVTSDAFVVTFDRDDRFGTLHDSFFSGTNLASLRGEGSDNTPFDRITFEKRFEVAMRDTAMEALDASETAALAYLDRLSNGLDASERGLMNNAIDGLEIADDLLAKTQTELGWAQRKAALANSMAEPRPGDVSSHAVASSSQRERLNSEVERLQSEVAKLEAERSAIAIDVPALLRIEDIDAFRKLPETRQVKTLTEAVEEVLGDVAETRNDIATGALNPWTAPNLVADTRAALGIEGERGEWIDDKVRTVGRNQMFRDGAGIVLNLGLVTIGSVGTGGAAAVAWVAGLGVGGVQAAGQTSEYVRSRAASNTDLDPTKGILKDGAEGHWGFVVASWVSLGVELGVAIRAAEDFTSGARDVGKLSRSLGLSEDIVHATLTGGKVNRFSESERSAEVFARQYGHLDADAVTIVRPHDAGGYGVEIVVRRGLDAATRKAALQHEYAHLLQLTDPAQHGDLALLTERHLAGWSEMDVGAKLDVKGAQYRVEIDAINRQLGEGVMSKENSAVLRFRQAELEGDLEVLELERFDGRVPEGLELDHPPRLFATGTARRRPTFPQAEWPAGVTKVDVLWAGRPEGRRALVKVTVNGKDEVWNVPEGMKLTDLDLNNTRFDAVEIQLREIAARWSPNMMTANEKAANRAALNLGENWLARLLERQARGRWVEMKMMDELESPKTRFFGMLHRGNREGMSRNTGIDFIDPSRNAYGEALSGTLSNMVTHARREAGTPYRMLRF